MPLVKVEETLEYLTRDPSLTLPGVAMAAFNGDDIFFSTAKGQLKKEHSHQMTLDSTFSGFSCTKLLTTIAVLQCVEKGLIGLDDSVDSILTELEKPDIINQEPNRSFNLTPAKNKITVRHLITHTSGLSYDAMHPVLIAWRKSRGESPMVMAGKLLEAFSLPLLFEPGTNWVYGSGLEWAGVLVERLNGGKSLGAYLANNLFEPLGLQSSTLRPESRPDILANLAQMWHRSDTGELNPIPSPYPLDARDECGGLDLVTSTSDFVVILQDLLKDVPVLLEAASVAMMFTPQFGPATRQYQGLIEAEAMHRHLTGDRTSQPEVAFGLGGLVVKKDVPNLPAGSLTWNGMPNIGWFVNRDRGLGELYVSQVLPPSDAKSVELLGDFWREVWAQQA